jgi:hypothetical protein
MAIIRHYTKCKKILCERAKQKQKITFEELAEALGVHHHFYRWRRLLDPISRATSPHDLSWLVVYKDTQLSPYFSDVAGGEAPRTTVLNPKDPDQRADYERKLQEVFEHYATRPC